MYLKGVNDQQYGNETAIWIVLLILKDVSCYQVRLVHIYSCIKNPYLGISSIRWYTFVILLRDSHFTRKEYEKLSNGLYN